MTVLTIVETAALWTVSAWCIAAAVGVLNAPKPEPRDQELISRETAELLLLVDADARDDQDSLASRMGFALLLTFCGFASALVGASCL